MPTPARRRTIPDNHQQQQTKASHHSSSYSLPEPAVQQTEASASRFNSRNARSSLHPHHAAPPRLPGQPPAVHRRILRRPCLAASRLPAPARHNPGTPASMAPNSAGQSARLVAPHPLARHPHLRRIHGPPRFRPHPQTRSMVHSPPDHSRSSSHPHRLTGSRDQPHPRLSLRFPSRDLPASRTILASGRGPRTDRP